MKTSKALLRCGRWLLAAGLSLIVPFALASEAAGVTDLLDRPAMHNNRASQAVTLSIAQAGPRLVAVGEAGIVLLSDDNGKTWRQAESVPVSVALTGVQFVSDTEGWAIGHAGVVLHTTDGGNTWSRQLDGRRIGDIAVDEARALEAAGMDIGRLMRDAELLVQDGPDKPLLGLYFADALHGWVVGAYGIALATADGGKSWQGIMHRIPNAGARHLYAISPSADGLLIAGEQGRLFVSHDHGERFDRIDSDYPGTWFGALPMTGDRVLAFGLRGNAWIYSAPEPVPTEITTDAAVAATAPAAPKGHWTQVTLNQAATVTAGLRTADGDTLLVDESARVYRVHAGDQQVAPIAQAPVPGITDIERSADGALVLASMRGPYRLELDPPAAGATR